MRIAPKEKEEFLLVIMKCKEEEKEAVMIAKYNFCDIFLGYVMKERLEENSQKNQ